MFAHISNQSHSLVTLVLADDHAVVREGLVLLLKQYPHLRVIGECPDGLEALRLVKRLRPNVLLLDLEMPGLQGFEVIVQVAKSYPETKVLVLSMQAEDGCVIQALRNGAAGYVIKGATSKELVRGINRIMEGKRFLSSTLSERVIERYVQTPAESRDAFGKLTNRERLILQLSAQGCTAKDIAEKLSISPRTAEAHRSNLMRKLGLHAQADLIRFAIRQGIITV